MIRNGLTYAFSRLETQRAVWHAIVFNWNSSIGELSEQFMIESNTTWWLISRCLFHSKVVGFVFWSQTQNFITLRNSISPVAVIFSVSPTATTLQYPISYVYNFLETGHVFFLRNYTMTPDLSIANSRRFYIKIWQKNNSFCKGMIRNIKKMDWVAYPYLRLYGNRYKIRNIKFSSTCINLKWLSS